MSIGVVEFTGSVEQAREIFDKRLRALTLAAKFWRLCGQTGDRKVKLEMARELHSYEMFSLNQLAKITRLSVGVVAREMRPNGPGGKLNPETLTALCQLRKRVIAGSGIYPPLIRHIQQNGTTISAACRLAGINNSSYYAALKREEAA